MPENTGAAEAPAAEATQPQVGAASTSQAEGAQKAQAAGAAAASGTDAPESMSPEEAAKLRKEANSLRKRIADFEKAQTEAAERDLSEAQKLAKRLEESERRHAERDERDRERDFHTAAVAMATRLDFRDPELAARLIDRSTVEFDDAGRARNLERLFREIIKDRAYLVRGTPDFGGGERGSTPKGTDMNAWIREQARGPR